MLGQKEEKFREYIIDEDITDCFFAVITGVELFEIFFYSGHGILIHMQPGVVPDGIDEGLDERPDILRDLAVGKIDRKAVMHSVPVDVVVVFSGGNDQDIPVL